MTPQTSPKDPRKERKKELEFELKLKKAALANMQATVFSKEQQILKLQIKKRISGVSQDSREVDEVSDSGSDWSDEEEQNLHLSC